MAKKENAGYKIIEECRIVNRAFVLGENEETGMFVTWETNICSKFKSYYWGHYFGDRKSAYRDYFTRIKCEAEYMLID